MSTTPSKGHVTGAYTHPAHRNKGYAKRLIEMARTKFPYLTFDTDRSDSGEGLVKSAEKKSRPLVSSVIKFRSFEEKNNKVKREKENSKKPHLRRGQHVCRGCWKHYHVMPRANKCRECGGDVYTVTKSSRLASAGESPVRYTLDINETIRQGLNNSRIQGRGDNPNTLQDASAGAVLADALDETGRPHGPFFRNLIHRNDYWLHRDNPGVGYLVHPTGNYRTLLDSPHPLLARTETPDGARWSFRPARSEEGTHAVYATRSLPHTTGPSTRNVRSHEAILHAPHLREWATHPSIPPTMRATLLNMADHLESTGGKEKMSRRGLLKRYMTGPQDLLIELQKPEMVRLPRKVVRYTLANRSNFIDALRRIKSSNQEAMHQVARLAAQRLGLGPTKILNALHDTPQGAVPGVAQAVYGPAPESHLNALGAWLGLTGNLPGVAVFHTRPNGPDTLYRVRVQGSGAEARARLDRLGLRNRVMIPHKAGFDVLVADKGSNLAPAVREFARIHGSQTEESRGHLAVIGSADQARAREMFRNTVVAQEQGAARG